MYAAETRLSIRLPCPALGRNTAAAGAEKINYTAATGRQCTGREEDLRETCDATVDDFQVRQTGVSPEEVSGRPLPVRSNTCSGTA